MCLGESNKKKIKSKTLKFTGNRKTHTFPLVAQGRISGTIRAMQPVITREQALEHAGAAIAYLRSCTPDESGASAQRWLRLLGDWMHNAETWQPPKLSLLDAKGYNGSINESGKIYGLCPHHLMPYYGSYQLHFRPGPYLAGLSSISRVVDSFCRRALLQESLTQELGEFFYSQLQAKTLKICIRARHFCREMQQPQANSSFVTRWQSHGRLKHSDSQQEAKNPDKTK